MPVETLEAIAAAVAAAATAAAPVVTWVAKKVLSRIDKVLHKFDAIETQVATVKADVKGLEEKVESVSSRVKKMEPVIDELKPNGGSSIKDVINQLMERVTILDGRHHARFDGDGLATYECGPDGMCTYASAALGELYGMSPEQFTGNGWLSAVETAQERQRVWDSWQAAVKAGIPYEDVYVVRCHAVRRRVRTYTRAVKDRSGKVLCYFGVVTDMGAPDHRPAGDD